MSTKIIIGPPGTGKTTELLKILDKELKENDPDKIAFVSFTRKGAYEARDRAVDQFKYTPNELIYFRTLHSIAFRELGVVRKSMLAKKHYKELSQILGLKFSGYFDNEEIPGTIDSGDRLLFLDSFARNTCQSLEDVWHAYGENTDWFRLKNVRDTFNRYKEANYLYDFTDLIEQFIDYKITVPVDVAIIDEAQDLSTLQWKMVNVAFKDAKKIYIAGDDDQALFKWAGADVKHFLDLKGELTFLDKSYRLPTSVFSLSQKVVSRIKNRHKKFFKPVNKKGSVTFHNHLSSIKFNNDEWLLLARNRYLLKEYEDEIKYQGLAYSTRKGSSIPEEHSDAIYGWERLRQGKHISGDRANNIRAHMGLKDREWSRLASMADFKEYEDKQWYNIFRNIPLVQTEYYRTVLRNGGNLRKIPTIHINSIHSIKGGEATNVVLMTDMAYKTYKGFIQNEDDENRVFYVGLTRAKENLHIILPQTDRNFSI